MLGKTVLAVAALLLTGALAQAAELHVYGPDGAAIFRKWGWITPTP